MVNFKDKRIIISLVIVGISLIVMWYLYTYQYFGKYSNWTVWLDNKVIATRLKLIVSNRHEFRIRENHKHYWVIEMKYVSYWIDLKKEEKVYENSEETIMLHKTLDMYKVGRMYVSDNGKSKIEFPSRWKSFDGASRYKYGNIKNTIVTGKILTSTKKTK